LKLEQVFDPRHNALNALRLALAAEVILFHSFPVTGRMPPAAILQLLFAVGVDGFFAISGFLIARSWLANPRLGEYLTARALRILPGFYVCLIVTAFVIAPIGAAIQGDSIAKLLMSTGPIEYVLKNSAVINLQHDIGGTPIGIPFGGHWNASLWSLIWEVVCYLAVAVLGVVGLATRQWVSPVLLVLAVVGALLLPPLTFPGIWTIPQLLARCVMMFAAGAVISVARRDSRSVFARGGERSRCRSGMRAAARLSSRGRSSAGVCHHRFRCADPQQALGVADGFVIRPLHLRIPDAAVAGHEWAYLSESGCILCRLDDGYPATCRPELIPGGEARDVAEIAPQAHEQASAERPQPEDSRDPEVPT
jgi:hypothetical protein